MTKVIDQDNQDAYYEDWINCCGEEQLASNSQRVTSAVALRIAADVLRLFDGIPMSHPWTSNDMKLARGAIAGIRAQHGVYTEDSRALMVDGCDTWHATNQLDVWIYG